MIRRILACFITTVASVWTTVNAEIVPVWSTGVAVPGEKVILYLVDNEVGEDVFTVENRPTVQHARTELLQPHACTDPSDPNRGIVEVFPILISPDQAGEIYVPDIDVVYTKSGRRVKVKVPALPVVSTGEIKWQEQPIRFGTLWYTEKNDGYVDQPIKTHVKFFLPSRCETPFPPQLQAVGVKISNFQPTVQGIVGVMQSNLLGVTTAYARGDDWRTTQFTGTVTPFREGNADIAGKIIISQQQSFFNVARAEAELPILTVEALPLPPGEPKNFAHLVGQYSVQATTTAKHLAMNEPVEVEITVKGTGNLELLECPRPINAPEWNTVPATRKPIVDSNGSTIGMVFHQLMRPSAEVSAIPSFAFGYFDPKAQTYRQAASAPIALPWKQSEASGAGFTTTVAAEPPPAGEVPVAEMTDIYGYLHPDEAGLNLRLPAWVWYLLYVPAVAIVLVVLMKMLGRRIAAGAEGRAQERELRNIEKESNHAAFLRHIGSFIESHIPPSQMPEDVRQILEQRDAEAFRPDSQTILTTHQRSTMLKRVRKALIKISSTAALLVALLYAPAFGDEAVADAAKAYRAGQFSAAIDDIKAMPQDVMPTALRYYNIGNCLYRLGNPGAAAHAYYCALLEDPAFKEARANLQFIQRKEGAMLPSGGLTDGIFTLLSVPQLTIATIISSAALALGLALLLALRHSKKPRIHAFTIFSLLLCLLCAADWVYYCTRETPDITALPPADLACVLKKTPLRTSADDKGSVIVNLTPSTPVHLLVNRGTRCYVELFAGGTRGWVNAADIQTCQNKP